jgi:hypothetical protein
MRACARGAVQFETLRNGCCAWKTEKAWAGNCRRLVVKLVDRQVCRASFNVVR